MDPEPEFLSTQIGIAVGFAVIFVLLFCSALVSAAEVALFSLSPQDLDSSTKKDPKKTKVLSRLLQRPKKLLATILVTNSFVNMAVIVLFFTIGTSVFAFISIPTLKFVVEIIVVTFFILLFGDVLPKIYANRNSLRFALFIAGPIAFLDTLLTPISIPLRSLTNFLNDKLGGKQKSNISVDQLSQALELTSSDDTTQQEQKILEGIVSFGNTEVRQVMSPRIDIFAIEISDTYAEILSEIIDKGFSRIPVYEENIDHIVGVLFVKDLIPHIGKKEFEWKALIREPFFVPENKKLDNLLKDFQGMKNHLAVVVDEYGGTSGIVTLEDVIEEIVGDISDEFDDDNISYSQIDDKTFLFEGKINLKDFYRIIDLDETEFEESKGEAETLAGFLLEILGNFPKKGQKINFANIRFTIESIDRKRIKQIKASIEND
ncbi:gliding motility-associated protein GldE [Flavobacterium sp. MAH-1]|uniref:Gliding motility-associated protein GldE n=1 Tax=Flavobacterium agri TaxID=2743471 RepID=A0A7Y8Y5A9_9FLAO|nr:gliding motility-associated protein GldE [Flavobacterium agri]NUY81531.1 gliding motility-associated protein GldE [Flavobacterium agri]NYA71555.1 gliding motility-associated protein GldE [Flavobacterium agri]